MTDAPHIAHFRADLTSEQRRGDGRIRSLEIAESDRAFFLFKLDAQGCVVWDSWHLDVKAAMNQAALDHGVPREQWTAIGQPKD